MTRKRARLILWISLEVLFLILVFIGSVYDFNISRALSGVTRDPYDSTLSSNVSFIAKALEVIGEWPALIFISFSCCVMVRNLRKKAKDTRVLLLMIAADIAVVVMMFYGWYSSFKDIFGKGNVKVWHYVFIAVMTLAFAFLIRFSVSKIKKPTLKAFFFPAVITIITGAIVLGCFEAIKFTWGRVRVREIVELSKTMGAEEALAKFTPWYVLNWFSGSKSFPSGHVGYSSLLFLIPIWFPKDAKEKTRRLTYLGVGIFLLIMGFSRLCAAAHYLTDVTFGFAISFIIVQIATVKYEKTFADRSTPKFIKTTDGSTGSIPAATTSQHISPETRSAPQKAPSPKAKELLKYDDQSEVAPPKVDETQQRRAAPPAKESRPLSPMRQTSFSLDRARAEKAESEARAAQRAENEAKRLDDNLRLAVTGDISIPVVPKQPPQTPSLKKPRAQKPKSSKKGSSKPEVKAVQMHFRYDKESENLTSDLSDD